MSNFYGKRFLSSLVGALTVLGSPVASAGKNGSGRGDLGEGVPSANRDKNNGNLGELKSNREVKSVNGLKEVLKETGGKVVRVSPDGKGGFVAFIKTPRGIVTATIVGVPLIFVLGLVASYVFSGQKNDGAKGKGGCTEVDIDEEKNPKIVVEGATGALLGDLFKGKRDEYDLFVGRLLSGFFNDKSGVLKGEFDNCDKSLDGFLRTVFCESSFQINMFGDNMFGEWKIKVGDNSMCRYIRLTKDLASVSFSDVSGSFVLFCSNMADYLCERKLVEIPEDRGEASWDDKISLVLFVFWYSVKFKCGFKDCLKLKEILSVSDHNVLGCAFITIRNYVRDRLMFAGRNYNGQ